MSVSKPTNGNSQAGEILWITLDIPKRTIRGRKLAAMGRRLSKRLRLGSLWLRLQGDQEYHKYLGM